MSKEKLREAIQSISKEEFQEEVQNLKSKPKKLEREVDKIASNMTEEQVEAGIKEKGSMQGLIDAIVSYIALKKLLVKRGIEAGIATGAGAIVIFGVGDLCEGVAEATGLLALGEMAEYMESMGGLVLDISLDIFTVTVGNTSVLGDLLEVLISLFE